MNLFFVLLLGVGALATASAQDRFRAGTKPDAPIRMATADFKALNADARTIALNAVFNQTLWNDLEKSDIFEMVAKSVYPVQSPGSVSELNLSTWGNPPANASMVIFGNLGVTSGRVDVQGWLFDAKNAGWSEVLVKQYKDDATAENAKLIAHRFGDEIIGQLGRGDFGSRFAWYVRAVSHKISTNWYTVKISPNLSPNRVLVTFDIQRDGTPVNLRIAQSSGVPALDLSTIRAVQRIDTFGPLPPGYSGNKVSVEFWFDYQR